MRSIEADFLVRLARVGAVVLALGVLAVFVMRAQRRAAPVAGNGTNNVAEQGAPIIELVPLRFGETIEDSEPDRVYFSSSKSGAVRPDAGPMGIEPLKVPGPIKEFKLPPLPVSSIVSDTGITDIYLPSSKAAVLLETPPPPSPPQRPGQP